MSSKLVAIQYERQHRTIVGSAKAVGEALKRFHEELKKRPEISDEEFMAEFEVSDEQ